MGSEINARFLEMFERKLDCITITAERVKNIDEKITRLNDSHEALHTRVDKVESDQLQIRRDMKWIAFIIAGILSLGKFLWGKIVLLWK